MGGLVLCGARWYQPNEGRWLTRDPIGYEGGSNLYEYCASDPIQSLDPEGLRRRGLKDYLMAPMKWGLTGQAFPSDEVWAGAKGGAMEGYLQGGTGLAHGMSFGRYNNKTYENTSGYKLGSACGVVARESLIAAGTLGASSALQALRAAPAAAAAFGGLSRAVEFGIQPYSKLRGMLSGTGLVAHHLLEKRFAAVLGVKARQMLSVAVTDCEHQAFTNAWRREIAYGLEGTGRATRESVMAAARKVYKNYPAILKELGL